MFQKLKKQGGELRFGSALIAKEVLQIGTLLYECNYSGKVRYQCQAVHGGCRRKQKH